MPQRQGMMLPMRVWDGPVRLFHWVLVALVLVSWISVEFMNNIRVHMLAGQALMALLLFRFVWGFVGSETARFSHFLKNPLKGLRHLAHFGRREPDTTVGHNEAGGWMVLALLLVLLAQVLTGMFLNNEESFVEGPLARLVSSEWGAWAMRQHHLIFNVIQVLVLGHVAAVILYGVVKRHDLVRPMITGKKRLPAATRAPRMASPVLAAVILAACAALVWAVVNLL
jgi:cytochrome b